MVIMRLKVFPHVYEPREDSYLMLSAVNCEKGERVLDMGCGTGIIAIKAALQGAKVLAIDVNKLAAKNALYNARLNGVKVKILVSDLFSAINTKTEFDKIFFNPPYIAEEPSDIYSLSWAAGKNMEIVLRFLEDVRNFLSENGKCYIIVSTLGKPGKVLKAIEKQGFSFRVIASERFFFEEIKLVEISNS